MGYRSTAACRTALKGALLGMSLVALACSPAEKENTINQSPVLPEAGMSSPPASAPPPAASMDASTPAPAPTPVADTGAPPIVPAAPDSGVAPAIDAAQPGAPVDAGSAGDAGALADAALAVDGGEGGVLSGPVMLPDPAMPGPFGSVTEENVGKGFENAIASGDMPGNNKECEDFALSFGQDEMQSREFAKIPAGMNMALYTLYRPANFEPDKKYPILSWANGTCALPQGYQYLLKHLASHGFWVIAANSRFTGDGSAQRKGIDVMIALSKDPNHPAYNRVDAEKVGIFGHSQGGFSTAAAESDMRVDTAAILNSGGGGARVPTYYMTGEEDLAPFYSELSYDLASAPAASINYKMSDHITLITEPMRIFPAVAAWFRYQLLGDQAGKDYFVGTSCKLCNRASEWSYRQKNLK